MYEEGARVDDADMGREFSMGTTSECSGDSKEERLSSKELAGDHRAIV